MSAAFDAALDRAAAAIGRLAPEAVERAALAARDEAAARSPVHSGRLRDGWRIEAAGDATRVVNAVPYAAAVEVWQPRPARPADGAPGGPGGSRRRGAAMSWRQELLDLSGRFAGAWPAVEPDVPVRWAGDPTPPPAAAPWLRFAVVPVAARAVGFVQDGQRLHRHDGLVTIDIFAPPGEGRARLLELADRAAAVLRGWSGSGLRCGAPSLSIDAAAEGWARASLAVPFARDTYF